MKVSTLSRPRLWTWVALGAGAALLVAAEATYLSAVADSNRLRSAPLPMSKVDVNKLVSSASQKETAAYVLIGVGAAGVVAGGALFCVEGKF